MAEDKNPIKAVIFDMGGVLLRTVDPSPRSLLAEKFGLNMRELEAVVFQSPHAIEAEEGKISRDDHWKAVAADLGMDEVELPDFIEQYWAGDAENLELVEFIRGLRPKYSTGLLSNAWSGVRETLEGQSQFLTVMDQIVFSSEVGLRKPDPEIYQLALARLGVPAGQAVFVDDFQVNIQAAKTAGILTVHFTDTDRAVEDLRGILNLS